MRALLERQLDEAGLSFPEWTVLIFLDGSGPLTLAELVRRQVDGRVAPEAEARAAVDGLLSRSAFLTTWGQLASCIVGWCYANDCLEVLDEVSLIEVAEV